MLSQRDGAVGRWDVSTPERSMAESVSPHPCHDTTSAVLPPRAAAPVRALLSRRRRGLQLPSDVGQHEEDFHQGLHLGCPRGQNLGSLGSLGRSLQGCLQPRGHLAAGGPGWVVGHEGEEMRRVRQHEAGEEGRGKGT